MLSILLSLKKNSIKQPKAAFTISTVTNLLPKYNAKNDVAPINSWSIWTNLYIADNDPTNPLLSPQFGNFEGIAPLYICVGTYEIHLDVSINNAESVKQCGVDVTLRTWNKMIRAFPLLSPLFPEANKALQGICTFVKRYTNYN